MKSYLYLYLFMIFVIFLHLNFVKAENLIITGDTKVLTNTTAHFQYSIDVNYPVPAFFQYEIHLDLPTGPIDKIVYSQKVAEWKYDFINIPAGSYSMNIKVFLYIFNFRAWEIAEKNIFIEVCDDIENFFTIIGKQDDLFTQGSVFVTNRTINFTCEYQNDYSALKSAQLDYVWGIKGPENMSISNQDEVFFFQNLTVPGNYKITVDIIANLTEYNFVKKGRITKEIIVKAPVTHIVFNGNNFVKNGSMLNLNVTWEGTSAFIFCYFFSINKSDDSCFDSGILIDRTSYSFSRYLDNNGTMFFNVGVRNDVSQVMKSLMITVYKIGPKQSVVFIILPLVSFLAVIVIIAFGIAHHIKRRANFNSTIETATIESFGLNRSSDSMQEISFFKRIKETIAVMLPFRNGLFSSDQAIVGDS